MQPTLPTTGAVPRPRRAWSDVTSTALVAVILFLVLFGGALRARAQWPGVVASVDGTPISYEVYGSGEPALVFVHGWSCDGRYWREQVPHFATTHRLVVMDLAGHGHSGTTRVRYTMRAFGEDVRAVVDASGGREVILIGHSMGGSVIAEAARLMPARVIGLIGVDTFGNVAYPVTRQDIDGMIAPLKKDFRSGCRTFVEAMIRSDTPAPLREWILADMAAAPPAVALSAIEEMLALYLSGEAAAVFGAIRCPVVTVNGDLWPIDYESNRRHMRFFDAIVLNDADHFLMLNRAEAFNRALARAIQMVLNNRTSE